MTLDYPGGSNVITRALESRGGRQKQTSERGLKHERSLLWVPEAGRGGGGGRAEGGVRLECGTPGMQAALTSKDQPLAHGLTKGIPQTHDHKELDLANPQRT